MIAATRAAVARFAPRVCPGGANHDRRLIGGTGADGPLAST